MLIPSDSQFLTKACVTCQMLSGYAFTVILILRLEAYVWLPHPFHGRWVRNHAGGTISISHKRNANIGIHPLGYQWTHEAWTLRFSIFHSSRQGIPAESHTCGVAWTHLKSDAVPLNQWNLNPLKWWIVLVYPPLECRRCNRQGNIACQRWGLMKYQAQ